MGQSIWIEFTAIALLILGNAFFALAEFSVVASRRARLAERVKRGSKGAKRALALRERAERFLASSQVGITLFGVFAGVLGGEAVVDWLTPYLAAIPIEVVTESARSIAIVTVAVAITVVSVTIGELVPKYLALAHPERFASLVAPPMSIIVILSAPFAAALSGLARGVVWLFGVRKEDEHDAVSEAEIDQMIVEGTERGIFDETEQRLVHSVFEFADSTVRRAMQPRPDVIAVAKDDPPERVLQLVADEGYSRYPVYSDTIDTVVGILNVKDLFTALRHEPNGEERRTGRNGNGTVTSVQDIMREPYFVPESMPLAKLLVEFQRGKNHLAIVLDDYGGTAGIITLEDVLEELVGEIKDEHDEESAPVARQSEHVVYADGAVWPGEVNNLMQWELPEEDVDTLAGLYIDHSGQIPDKMDSTQVGDVLLTVLEKDGHRIKRMKLERVVFGDDETDDND